MRFTRFWVPLVKQKSIIYLSVNAVEQLSRFHTFEKKTTIEIMRDAQLQWLIHCADRIEVLTLCTHHSPVGDADRVSKHSINSTPSVQESGVVDTAHAFAQIALSTCRGCHANIVAWWRTSSFHCTDSALATSIDNSFRILGLTSRAVRILSTAEATSPLYSSRFLPPSNVSKLTRSAFSLPAAAKRAFSVAGMANKNRKRRPWVLDVSLAFTREYFQNKEVIMTSEFYLSKSNFHSFKVFVVLDVNE